MEIIYIDGTKETFDKADFEQCEIQDDFYIICDNEGEVFAQINVNSIKKIRWD
jgi:hypothetical protein